MQHGRSALALEPHRHGLGRHIEPGQTRRIVERDALRLAEAGAQRSGQIRARGDVTEGLEPELARVQAYAAEPAALGDADGAHGRRARRERRPDPDALEDTARAVGEREIAIRPRALGAPVRRARLDHRRAQAGAVERARKARAHQAAADDDQIARGLHRLAHRPVPASINASISSISLGIPALSTSGPSRVTSTSSSMRTPMFHHRLATPLLCAGM